MAAVFAEIVKKRNVLSFFETEKIDLIIPVPISRHALTKRGYNQSRLLADELSFLLKAPVAENIILKSWKAARQTGLAQQERIKNAKRAILCRKNISLAGRTILLVDDVATTGSTLEACAEKLIERGARRILAFVLARTSE